MPFKGREMLLKLTDELSPPTFTTVAGLRTNTLSVNLETVDITTDEDGPWRMLQEDSGLRTVSTSAAGVFKDDAVINTLEGWAFDHSSNEMQLTFGNGDIIQGMFVVTSFEYAGEHSAEQTYSIALESSDICTLIRA